MAHSADYGTYKLEVKTKADNGVEFTTSGNSNHDSGKVGGSLETKYKYSDYGKSMMAGVKVELSLKSPIPPKAVSHAW